MAWKLYQLTYELLSPLHIGYHKVGSVQRTRYYIPARNVWAAVTERLTHSGFHTTNVPKGDYPQVGEWVREHCAFSYFFLSDGSGSLYPNYTIHGLCYGSMREPQFERLFLAAHVTTALQATSRSAAEGSLHEVEFVAVYDANGVRTRVTGWVFLDESARNEFADGEWRQRLPELQMGGERRYGFGRLRLDGAPEAGAQLGDYAVENEGKRPIVKVDKDKPLLAHTLAHDVKAEGMIEPLVGRETVGDSTSFGRSLTTARLCWTPGAVCKTTQWFAITGEGIWEMVRR